LDENIAQSFSFSFFSYIKVVH